MEGYDCINPAHYRQHPKGIECIDVIEEFPYNVAACMKYLWRAGLKPGTDAFTDLQKAAWYISREIERVKRLEGGK
jgi:hypothetical protein